MCKNIFTNEIEFDLNGPITDDGVHYYGFGCSQNPTGFGQEIWYQDLLRHF